MATEAAKALAHWLKPHEAVARLSKAFESDLTAVNTMNEWLKGGMMQAVAMRVVVDEGGRRKEVDVSTIDPTGWNNFAQNWQSSFWKNGLITHARNDMRGGTITTRYYDVRFDPNDVQKIDDIAPNKIGPDVAPDAETAEDEVPKGPPVSAAHLQAWFEVYKQAYEGPADTLARALKSARGMFPGKFVSRDKVRKLCEGRKRGRKSAAAN